VICVRVILLTDMLATAAGGGVTVCVMSVF